MVKLNRLKKFLCSAVMTVVALTSVGVVMPVVEVSASYIQFVEGDVDNSGSVSMTDLVTLNKYLRGFMGLNNASVRRSDTNHDKLIDQVDYKKVVNYNLGIGTLNSTSGYTYTSIEDVDRDYLKHDFYDTNPTALTHFDEYTLEAPGEAYTYSSNGRRRALASTLFTLDTENITTVRIEQKSSNGTMVYKGSGFVVDNHIVATAAHVVCTRTNPQNNTGDLIVRDNLYVAVYDEDENQSSSTLISSSENDNPCKVKSIHVPKLYEEGNLDYSYLEYDYALIYVDEDLSEIVSNSQINPTTEEKVSLGYTTNEFINTHANVYTSGYTNDGRRYYDGGVLMNSGNDHILMSQASTSGGDSGGPVYYETTFNGQIVKTVVGIHGGRNFGNVVGARSCRVTPTVARFYLSNDNITE